MSSFFKYSSYRHHVIESFFNPVWQASPFNWDCEAIWLLMFLVLSSHYLFSICYFCVFFLFSSSLPSFVFLQVWLVGRDTIPGQAPSPLLFWESSSRQVISVCMRWGALWWGLQGAYWPASRPHLLYSSTLSAILL